MASNSNPRHKLQAFSLIELSALLVVVAIAMSTILSVSTGSKDQKARETVIDRRTEIVDAINDYLDRNGRYPCVASYTQAPATVTFGREILADCTAVTTTPGSTLRVETAASSGVFVRVGAVPVRDLLLDDEYMNDGYGNRYTYIVMEGLTKSSTYSASTAALVVKNAAGTDVTTAAAYAVFSHGKDGKGAYRFESGTLKVACGATTNLDVENCDGDATLRQADYSETTNAALFYDDLAHYEPKGTPGAGSPSPSPDFTGFRLDGPAVNAYAGYAVATGDINNDGYDDVIVGAFGGNSYAGYTYVVFGSATGIDTPLDLTTLDGTNGFRLDGTTSNNYSGRAVSSGDVNNDGYDDVIIGAYAANSVAGYTYVVFGKSGAWAATTALSSLNGTTGFRLDGTTSNNYSGRAVSSGDVNNDGYDDVIIGAYAANSWAGYTYVVFGKAGAWAATTALSSLDGTTGFRLDGPASSYSGVSVNNGDINNDGYDDVIVGAQDANGAGYTYVVFGKSGAWAATTALSSLNGTTGFRLDSAGGSSSGVSVSSGNINNDGYDDVIIGAHGANSGAGYTYVVFGKSGAWAATTALSSLDGTTGFRLDGPASSYSGVSVNNGDINNDGYGDVIVGAQDANSGAGYSYVVFGKACGWAATTALSSLNGTTGFRLDGVTASDYSGWAVSSGDITGDGFADIIVGAFQADNNSRSASGSTYGIYGKASGWSTTYNLDTLTVP